MQQMSTMKMTNTMNTREHNRGRKQA